MVSESRPREHSADPSAADRYRHHLETIATNATLALFIMDERQCCDYMNPAAEHLTGYTLSEVQGRRLHDVIHHTRPDGSPFPLSDCPIDRAFPENNREQGEEVFVHKDGHFYPVAYTASPIREGGRPVGTILEVRDITSDIQVTRERQQRNRQVELSAAIGRALATNDLLSTQLRHCTEALVTHLDAAFARIWTLNDATQVLELTASSGMYTHLDGAHSRIALGSYKIGRIAKERRPHLTNTVLTDEGLSDPDWARREGMVAFAGYPLLVSERLVGVLGLFARYALPESTLAVLNSIVDMIAVGVDRSQAEAERAALLTRITDAVFALDRDWRITYLNPQGEALLGRPSSELIGYNVWDLYPDARDTEFYTHYHRAMTEQVTVSFTSQYESLGLWVDVRAYPSQDGLTIFARDSTDTNRAQQELQAAEQRYRTLIEHSPAVTYTEAIGSDGPIIYMSPQIEALTGYTAEAFLEDNRFWHSIIHPDDREATSREVARTDAAGAPFHLEHRYIRRDGRPIWVRNDAVLIRDALGRPQYWQGFLVDITENKQIEAALRNSEERFRSIFEDAAISMAVARPDGRFQRVNHAFESLFGYSEAELQTMSFLDLTHPEEALDSQAMVGRLLRGEIRSFQLEKRYIHKHGHTLWGLLSISAVTEDGHLPAYLLPQVQDITERKRAEAEVAEQIRRREEFLSIAAHELKTPLTTIKATVQLIDRRMRAGIEEPEQVLRFVTQQESQIERLEALINDLLDASRIDRGHLTLRRDRLDLVALAEEIVERFEQAPERRATHTLVVDAAGPVQGHWDQLRLDQVLTNLVSNALKYSPNGGEVRIRVRQMEGYAEVSVHDQGTGIDSAFRSRVFEPFARREMTVPDASGTGLGLYITKQIVERHGGVIELESTVGQGSVFIVRLPLAISEQLEQA